VISSSPVDAGLKSANGGDVCEAELRRVHSQLALANEGVAAKAENIRPARSAARAADGPTQADPLTTILNSFQGDFNPIPRRIGYRLGIILVSFAMIFLPLLYLGLICGVAYLIYLHARYDLAALKSTRSVHAIVFLYGGPIFAGLILLFFMIKPLLARSPKLARVRVLEPDKEPTLFAFVDRIADTVGAPEPKQIQVDCEVNASASFGTGFAGLFGRNLVLTIGMPLVGGFSTEQLAGVLAHELGHFSQGAGMRFSYVIRAINHWLVRVVYERDEWDEGLVRYSEEESRLAPIFWLALFGIFISRVILWVFMALGHVISCFLLRHMEYDADAYEARLVGSDVFEASFRRMASLEVAANAAHSQAIVSWSKERLPEDIPGLILFHNNRIPTKLSRLIDKDLKKTKTGFFDTHPCFRDRVDNVRNEDAAGIFHLEEPATVLLNDYPKLCRLVTKDFYRQMLGKNLKRATFISVQEAVALEGEMKEAAEK
jgi:Zn-dependent protease with chaperone function